MINLLPEEVKKEIIAARTNVVLVNYMLILGLGVLFLAFIFGGVYVVLTNTEATAKNLIAENQSKTTAYSAVQNQATALKASLSTAKTILDKEVVYTKVVTGIAAALPKGVVLETLSLTPTTFGSPVTLQAYAKDNDSALQLKTNFQRSPLFSDVTFLSLSSNPDTTSDYPVSVSLSVVINKSASQ